MQTVSIHLYPATSIETVAEIWRKLELRIHSSALTCSWDWTEAWLKHYGHLMPHAFAVGEHAGVPCGIVLVTRGIRHQGPFKIQSRHLGTAGEPETDSVCVEYNRVLSLPEERSAFVSALISELAKDAGWDELSLDGFASEDAKPFLICEPRFRIEQRASHLSELSRFNKLGSEILPSFDRATRRKIRHSMDLLGNVETEWANSPEQAMDIFRELTEMHQKRWITAGHPGAFSSAIFRSFHTDIISRFFPRGSIFLFRARGSNGTIGCIYGFIEEGKILVYQTGMNLTDYSKLTPGRVVHLLAMQQCTEKGFKEYDFLAGENSYKRDLSNHSRELLWATFRRPRLKFRVIDSLRTLKRWAAEKGVYGQKSAHG